MTNLPTAPTGPNLAEAHEQAAALDNDLILQGTLDVFTSKVWQRGLKDLLLEAAPNPLQMNFGLVAFNAALATDDEDVKGAVIYLMAHPSTATPEKPATTMAFATLFKDETATFHCIARNGHDDRDLIDLLTQLCARWTADKVVQQSIIQSSKPSA